MHQEIEHIVFSRFVSQPIPFEFISISELFERCHRHGYDLATPHRIEFHALLLITNGTGTHTIDFTEYSLAPGVILPIAKGQVHAFQKDTRAQGHIISCTEDFITKHSSEQYLSHFWHLFTTPYIQASSEDLQSLTPALSLLQNELKHPDLNLKPALVHVSLMTVLLQIKRFALPQHPMFSSQRFTDFIRFQKLIVNHYTTTHNAKDYATMLTVSYKYLNDICKEISNTTAKAFIDHWLILEIKRNLSTQKHTSQEIAYQMGFKEHSNFIRFFKKFTGITPHQFQASV